MAITILLTIDIYIGPIKFLEVGPSNAKYDSEQKFCKECININWGDSGKIEEAMARQQQG